MTLKVIPVLQAFSSAIHRTFVKYFTRFQLTARSRGPSATAGLLVLVFICMRYLRSFTELTNWIYLHLRLYLFCFYAFDPTSISCLLFPTYLYCLISVWLSFYSVATCFWCFMWLPAGTIISECTNDCWNKHSSTVYESVRSNCPIWRQEFLVFLLWRHWE